MKQASSTLNSAYVLSALMSASMLITAPPARASDIVAFVPGNTVIQDRSNDQVLRNCDASQPALPCSLPPNAPLGLPPWADIKTVKITALGNDRVDLSIALYAPIPAAPPVSRSCRTSGNSRTAAWSLRRPTKTAFACTGTATCGPPTGT